MEAVTSPRRMVRSSVASASERDGILFARRVQYALG
jgi:hypothetical protein